MFKFLGSLTVAIVATLAMAVPASAGWIQMPGSESPPVGNCSSVYYPKCGDQFTYLAPTTSGRIWLEPNDNQTYYANRSAWVDLEPPEWDVPVQGYEARVHFSGSVMGTNWRAVACPSGAGDTCNGLERVWGGEDEIAIPTGASMRIMLRYVGANGHSPPNSTIHLQAYVSWHELDSQPPNVSLKAGGFSLPWQESHILNANNTALELEASDNTGITSSSLTVDGSRTTLPPDDGGGSVDLKDGVHDVAADTCDRGGNCVHVDGGKITVDTTPPTGFFPAAQVVYDEPTIQSCSATPRIRVVSQDPVVNGYASGVAGTPQLLIGSQPATAVSSSGSTLVYQAPSLTQGTYLLTFNSSDIAGNISDDSQVALVVDLNRRRCAMKKCRAGRREVTGLRKQYRAALKQERSSRKQARRAKHRHQRKAYGEARRRMRWFAAIRKDLGKQLHRSRVRTGRYCRAARKHKK